jgi:hypothetical protein
MLHVAHAGQRSLGAKWLTCSALNGAKMCQRLPQNGGWMLQLGVPMALRGGLQ